MESVTHCNDISLSFKIYCPIMIFSPGQMPAHPDGIRGGNQPGSVLIFTNLIRIRNTGVDYGMDKGTDK